MSTTRDGHTPGTAQPQAPAEQGAQRCQQDLQSFAHGWPRLLDAETAARYLSVSKWCLIELMNAGDITPIRIRRPRTARAMKTKPVGDVMRRRLFDRLDLDALVDRWRAEGVG